MSIETRISKRDNKPRYLVRVEVRSPDGTRKQQRVGTFTNKRAAESAEAQAVAERERGTLLKPDNTTVAELLDEWLRVKASEITPNSRHDYEVTIRRHLKPAIGLIKIQNPHGRQASGTVRHVGRAGYVASADSWRTYAAPTGIRFRSPHETPAAQPRA